MSTEAKFTPGPWKLITDAQGPCMVMHPNRKGVAIASLTATHVPSKGFHDDPSKEPSVDAFGVTYQLERNANARLIAAAPSMYAALKAMIETPYQDIHEQTESFRIARAAIAAAEGRAE